VTLKLLAYAFHTTAGLAVLAWRQAVIARRELSILRTPAYRHCLRRVRDLGPSAPIHCRRRSTALIQHLFEPVDKPPLTETNDRKNLKPSAFGIVDEVPGNAPALPHVRAIV
jgi:hypothetical protein